MFSLKTAALLCEIGSGSLISASDTLRYSQLSLNKQTALSHVKFAPIRLPVMLLPAVIVAFFSIHSFFVVAILHNLGALRTAMRIQT